MSWGFVRDYDILPRPGWVEFLRRVTTPLMRARGVTVAYEGLEHVPSKPSLMVGNSTHRYEVVLLRWALDRRGIGVVIASKGKNYHAPWMRHFCVVAGSLPLVSRGYILTMDFLHVHGRRPTEEEYRALRDHGDAPGKTSRQPLIPTGTIDSPRAWASCTAPICPRVRRLDTEPCGKTWRWYPASSDSRPSSIVRAIMTW